MGKATAITGSARTRQGASPLHPGFLGFLSSREAQNNPMGSKGPRPFAGAGRARKGFLALLAVALFAAAPAHADEATETRLRDALRQAITQSRALEDSQAQLQAKLAEAEKQIEALRAQPVKAKPDAAILDAMEAEFNRRLAEQHATIARADETLTKWKGAYQEAASAAQAKEAERAQLAAQLGGFSQRAQSCEAKNAALFDAANEILGKLKNISVADAMAAHEPFVGMKKVELQNLAQDAEDKILDQVATPQRAASLQKEER
ncbi:MAG: hypothetical protein RBR34_08995 [Rhodospirillaceae bacterium]|nr:hypothetical protein [Rhodospirillaceae bacterium]